MTSFGGGIARQLRWLLTFVPAVPKVPSNLISLRTYCAKMKVQSQFGSAGRSGFMTKYLFLAILSFSSSALSVAQAVSANQLPGAPSSVRATSPPPYVRPSERTKFHNFIFDSVGPYPILGAALVAGINQADSTPPEWGQGAEAFGKRFISNFGIAAVTTSARYGMAAVFQEDTLYYRCACKGILPRLGNAMISTVMARRGEDGHRGFSVSAVAAPYVGTMTAVYVWYPDRYNGKDAFRMGNYSLLGVMGSNIALEFLYGGPHTLLSKIHLGTSR